MISIIIIVKNDHKIDLTLTKLEQIKKPIKTEIIVVDASKGELDNLKKIHRSVKWLYFNNIHKKKTTIPDQRNMGIKAAKGDIIVFIDSDCTPHDKWLVELTKYIIDGSETIVSGKVIDNDPNSPHEIENEKKVGQKYIGECPTMNVAYSKKLFNTIGLFDESFKFGSDVDFSWRALKKGFKIRYNPLAIIYHDLGDSKNNYRRMYDYGKARVVLYKKHEHKRILFWGNDMLYIFYPLYFIFLPLTFIIPIYPLLILIPITKYFKRDPLRLIPQKTMYGLGVFKEMLSFR